MSATTSVYLAYDEKDKLLYVGITGVRTRRFSQHRLSSKWWDKAARLELEHYSTRAKAQKLREQGLTYREIGERLGVTGPCVYRWLKPEWAREMNRRSNAKRGPAKRKWERENRAECPSCGGPMKQGSRSPSKRSDRCLECVRDKARSRSLHFIELRKQGLTNQEIEASEGLGFNVVAQTLSRAHRYGLSVPPSPYRNRGNNEAASGRRKESSR